KKEEDQRKNEGLATSKSEFYQDYILGFSNNILLKLHKSFQVLLTVLIAFTCSFCYRADVIQSKFVITKALLCNADRSSFHRLRLQIYKLELEQKRLEEDAFVYNSLQQQPKLSPVYQKVKSRELVENRDDEFANISFEELLAQEKKDSF
ncbi:hypothetical protein S245_024284, partial [Arachis hypogaea]